MKNSLTNLRFFKTFSPRTDLACESINSPPGTDGTTYEEYEAFGIKISVLHISTKESAVCLGRPCGRYATIHTSLIRSLSEDEKHSLTSAIASELVSFTERLTEKPIGPETRILVAGLGNRFISADSIGPRTADKIAVTGHMEHFENAAFFDILGCSRICAVHPGVMGQTGIEAVAMIKGAADYARPDVIIAVDALAARSTDRLCATVQLSDSGIEPGSGIGNRRGAINAETVGFPVIALGVPTVVDCATLVFDALSHLEPSLSAESIYPHLEKEQSFFVSLRDSDIVSEEISSILACAVNRAFMTEGL